MQYRNYSSGGQFFWIGIIIFFLFGGFRTIFLIIPLIFTLIPLLIAGFFLRILFRGIANNTRLRDHINNLHPDRTRFVEVIVHILVHAMKADGHVDQREIQVLKQFFQVQMRYTAQQMMWVSDLINHAINSNQPLETVCQECRTNFQLDVHMIVLELVYRVVAADGVIKASEKSFIEKVVRLLGISTTDHQRIASMYTPKDNGVDHYAVLGVTSSASKDEIKKAYREACKKYHPDKVQHLGEEFRKVAEEKIKKINESYAIIGK